MPYSGQSTLWSLGSARVLYHSRNTYSSTPHGPRRPGPNNLLAVLWFWTNDPPTDQWPPGLQIRPPNGIWSQDLHTLGSYDWQLKICPEDRMAKNGDSKWPSIECRKLRQGYQVNLSQEQIPGKFPCNPGVTIMWPRRQLKNGPLTYCGRNV